MDFKAERKRGKYLSWIFINSFGYSKNCGIYVYVADKTATVTSDNQ